MNPIIQNNLNRIFASISSAVFDQPVSGFNNWLNGNILIILLAVIAAFGCVISLAFVLVPLKFRKIPLQMFCVPMMGLSLLGLLILDKNFSSLDGIILLLGFVLSIACLLNQQKEWLNSASNRLILVSSSRLSRLQIVIYSAISFIFVISAGEIFNNGGTEFVSHFKLSNGIFGLTLPAFLVILREFTITRSAYFRNRMLITPANIAGFILAFFLFDCAVYAIWQRINPDIMFVFIYLPFTAIVSGMLCAKLLKKWNLQLMCGCIIAMYCGYILMGLMITA